jgi:alpha-tubulin suppressor-like RCC1 family protein
MLDVSAGEASSCAVNGSDMFCWGDIAGSPLPVRMKVPSGPAYMQVATGARHACTSFKNMSLMCIGDNQFGQLGDGTNTTSSTGTLVWGGTLLTSYVLSWGTSCGADAWSGIVACWGNNGQGELGDGTTFNANTPQFTLIPSSFSATEIGIGFSHVCAIDGKGAALCWGDNRYAQLGIGELTNPPVTVPVSVAAGWQLP